MDLAQVVAVGLVVAAHALALRRPWRVFRREALPPVVDFATLGVVLYYDLGLLAELAGADLWLGYFEPFLDADDRLWVSGLALLGVAPWLLRLGGRLAWGLPPRRPPAPVTLPNTSRLPLSFWLAAWALSGALAAAGLLLLTTQGTIWAARTSLREHWGPLAVVLYVPIYLVAFVVGRGAARRPGGLLGALGLAIAGALAVVPVGQRTRVLLPFVMLALFRRMPTPTRLVIGTLAVVLAATLLLPVLKRRHAEGETGPADWIANVAADLSRAPVLRMALEEAEPLGTHVLPYAGAGYAHAAMVLVPRAWLPAKGYGTGTDVTAYLLNHPVETLHWGFAIGLVEEALLNVGWLATPPVLLVVGVLLGRLDRASHRRIELRLPTRLGAAWLIGYGCATTLVFFGLIALVGWAAGWVWPARHPRTHGPRRAAAPLVHVRH